MTSKARNLSNLVADDGQLEIDVVRHSVRPSLLLDFANSKQLDPRITFSRASTGTYYDGKTFAKAEENLIYPSQEFTYIPTSRFTQENNTSPAPDGTNTATEIRETSINDFHDATHSTNITYAGETTISAYVKPIGRQYLYIYTSSSPNYSRVFDIVNGTVQTGYYSSGSQAAGSITDAGNGWYRVSITFTSTNSNKKIVFGTILSGGNFDSGFTGDTNKGFYVWGVQVETRSAPTAYTPTTTQPITNYIPVLQTAAAGTARFDHDPVTGESKGLLIEEQRTNLLTYSEDFSHSSWTKNYGTQTGNTVIAIDGSLSGSTFTCTSSGIGVGLRRDLVSYTAGNFYTASFYVKYVDAQYVAIDLPDAATSTNDNAVFDILNGTVVKDGNTSNGGYASIIDVGNGWYRISITGYAQSTLASGFVALYFNSSSSSYNPGYSGVGKSFKVWGAQVEAGAFPTSYIKTTSAQATRNADAASMTGTNFSSWFSNKEGTYTATASCMIPTPGNSRILSDSGISIRQFIGLSSNYAAAVYDGSAVSVSGGAAVNTVFKSAMTYTETNKTIALNGNTNTSARNLTSVYTLTPSTGLAIAPTSGAFEKFSGTINKISYYPKALTTSELQALTEE